MLCSDIHTAMSTPKCVEHYLHSWCQCSKSNTNQKLRSRLPTQLVDTHPKHPALNCEHFTPSSYNNMKAIKAIKAVHQSTLSGLSVLSTPYGSFQYTSFRPDLNWNALRTQTKYSKYRNYGYRNTALVIMLAKTSSMLASINQVIMLAKTTSNNSSSLLAKTT